MTPEETSLARLLVALPGFKCTSGLLVRSGFRAIRIQCEPIEGATARTPDEALRLIQYLGAVPDLHDPATAGILLGMLAAIAPPEVYFGVGAVRVTWSDTGSADGPRLGVAAARALVAIGRCA